MKPNTFRIKQNVGSRTSVLAAIFFLIFLSGAALRGGTPLLAEQITAFETYCRDIHNLLVLTKNSAPAVPQCDLAFLDPFQMLATRLLRMVFLHAETVKNGSQADEAAALMIRMGTAIEYGLQWYDRRPWIKENIFQEALRRDGGEIIDVLRVFRHQTGRSTLEEKLLQSVRKDWRKEEWMEIQGKKLVTRVYELMDDVYDAWNKLYPRTANKYTEIDYSKTLFCTTLYQAQHGHVENRVLLIQEAAIVASSLLTGRNSKIQGDIRLLRKSPALWRLLGRYMEKWGYIFNKTLINKLERLFRCVARR